MAFPFVLQRRCSTPRPTSQRETQSPQPPKVGFRHGLGEYIWLLGNVGACVLGALLIVGRQETRPFIKCAKHTAPSNKTVSERKKATKCFCHTIRKCRNTWPVNLCLLTLSRGSERTVRNIASLCGRSVAQRMQECSIGCQPLLI